MAKEETKKEKKKSPLVLVSIAMMFMMTMLVLIVVVLVNPQATKMVKDIKFGGGEEELYTKPIEFTTEVKSKDGEDHYIQGGIVLSTGKKKEMEKLNKEAVKLNDLYIRYFSTVSVEDVETLAGQDKIKKELKELIKKDTGHEIKGVYFTKWLFN